MAEISRHSSGDDDPSQIVRTIGRLAQMIIELRDEYVAHANEDVLDQLERRLAEMSDLRTRLRHARNDQTAAG
ncbi:MAG: hypothetical protein M9890_10855 [Thermomicrobiales bacterium]|nr:hypothetical protein [Thermomicrobiales bacterium]